VINGKEIPAHKLVLSAKSPKFSDMFTNQDNDVDSTKKDDSDKIKINNTNIDAFKLMLKYFYNEKFDIQNKSDIQLVKEVFKLAQIYKVKRLLKKIEIFMKDNLNIDNFKEIFEFAYPRKLNGLVKGWREFVNENFETIINNQLYLCESNHMMESILVSIRVNESQKIDAIEKIHNWRPNLNITRFRNLVRIPECSIDDLLSLKRLNLFDSESIFNELLEKYKQMRQINEVSVKSFDKLHRELENLRNSHENLRACNERNNRKMFGCASCQVL